MDWAIVQDTAPEPEDWASLITHVQSIEYFFVIFIIFLLFVVYFFFFVFLFFVFSFFLNFVLRTVYRVCIIMCITVRIQ